MMRHGFSRTLTELVAAIGMIVGVRSAVAVDVFWIPTGTNNYATGTNWENFPGTGTIGRLPDGNFDELATIINGGTADVSSAITVNPGSVRLGVAPGNLLTGTGTLRILPGGNLAVTALTGSTDSNGSVVVGAAIAGVNGTGTLEMTGGTLSANSISLGGANASAVKLGGSSVVNLTAASTFGRDFRITGPNVTFNSTAAVTLQAGGGAGQLTAEITSGTHSPIKTTGNIALGGRFAASFTGVTPALDQSWTIADSASISGNFTNAIGTDLAVTGATAPVGSAFRLRNVAGGNGRQLQLALERLLVLTVNRDTGEMTIRNPQSAQVTQLVGYTVTSARGSLLPGYKGISGAPAGNAGWEKIPTNSTTGLGELKPAGSFNVSAPATAVTLGTGFSKTGAVAGLGVAGLGINGEDLVFDYTNFGGTVVRGQIEYIGATFFNDVILNVTASGAASLKNDTMMPISLDGYSIVSTTGALSGAGWDSLQDKPAARFNGWLESPATASALSETNPDHPLNPLILAPGESVSLGDIGDFSTPAAQAGLSLKYIFGNTPPTGDFDGDGDVDGHDFIALQRGGALAANTARWRPNYGQTLATGAPGDPLRLGQVKFAAAPVAAVPEPAALQLCLFGGALATVFAKRQRQSRRVVTINRGCVLGQGRQRHRREDSIMTRTFSYLAALSLGAIIFLSATRSAEATVTMSASVTQPTVGPADQSNVMNDATIPGGTTPGGGTYNSQAFSDNAGPPGQTFTTPTGAFSYTLSAFSYKGANTPTGNFDPAVFTAGTTWGVRISLVTGTTLTPFTTVTMIPTVTDIVPTGTEWFTWTFADVDIPRLGAGSTYAFETFSSASYMGWDAAQNDTAYPGGTAFNSAGTARTFTGNTLGNLANHGYDRTFHAALTSGGGVAGDVNNSGAADIADYNIIRTNLETTVTAFTNGDLNGDARVDLTDFRRWTAVAPPAVVASIGVPEPSSIALGVFIMTAGAWLQRRRLHCKSIGAALIAMTAFAPNASAQSLGFNFASDEPNPGVTGSTLLATDVAGVVPAANWNNLAGASGSTGGLFYNNAGTAVASTVTVTWNCPNLYQSTEAPLDATMGNNRFPVGPNRTLLTGYLDSNQNADGGVTVTVDGIDAALRSPAYDVYVYIMSDVGDNRGGGYTLNDGLSSTLKYGSTQNQPSAFQEDPGTDADNSIDGNYLRFRGLTGTSFTLTTDATLTTPNGVRAPVAAIQIVGGVMVGAPGPGDVNEDGFTNLTDYNLIKGNFFRTTGVNRMAGDLNLDGRIDLADYRLWRNNVPLSVAAQVAIPEPTAATLAAGALALAALSRHARRISS